MDILNPQLFLSQISTNTPLTEMLLALPGRRWRGACCECSRI